ncbi:UNVERIFIED_CONTAM: hypothetical protein Sindi_2664700 [Sesamum indicum]
MTHKLKKHGPKHAFRVQGSRPIASDSSTDCTRSSLDSGEMATIESQEEYQRILEKIISRKGVNLGKTNIKTSGTYNRVWMLEGWKPEDVREWYAFGAFALVHTMSPSFPEISKLSESITGASFIHGKTTPT